MEPRQFRALLAVDEHGSFSAAARALGTVQSNVSTHIARLEDELDEVLIDRATITLTESGRVVATRARRIEAELASLESDLASLRDVVRGEVSLGVIGTTARWLAPRLLSVLAADCPEVKLRLLDGTTTALILQLQAGQIDAAVVTLPSGSTEVVEDPLFEEDGVLVAPVGHALYDRSSLSVADLAGHPLLLEAPGTTFRTQLDDAARASGVELTPQAEVDGMRLLASLVFGGFGAAVLPAGATALVTPGPWRSIPLRDGGHRTIGVVRRRRAMPSPAERAVTDRLREIIGREAPLNAGIHPR
ncbi:MAG: LysR family transcriptional regulator [Microthrixaceae bacterium]